MLVLEKGKKDRYGRLTSSYWLITRDQRLVHGRETPYYV